MERDQNYTLIVLGIFSIQCAFSLIFSFWVSYKIAKLEEKVRENARDIDNIGSSIRLNKSRIEAKMSRFIDECSRKFRDIGHDSKFTNLD